VSEIIAEALKDIPIKDRPGVLYKALVLKGLSGEEIALLIARKAAERMDSDG
jgi:hypothetical protein